MNINMWSTWFKLHVKIEEKQSREEGRDISLLLPEFTRLLAEDTVDCTPEFQEAANELMGKCQLLPMRPDYPYVEPSDLASIRAERRVKSGKRTFVVQSEAEIKNRIAGAWLGRCAGCLLGKPIEGTIRPRLVKLLDDLGLKEISDYIPRLPGITIEHGEGLNSWAGNTLPYHANLTDFPGDDDTNYTVLGMVLIKEKGIHFTPSDVLDVWSKKVPIGQTCTAEYIAYMNYVNGFEPPYTATVHNPYREYIGGRIRGDFFGYVALGRLEFAAELAWRDASISHVKNGIYGAMWVAAVLAAAGAGVSDARELIEIGLDEIPQRSRLFEGISDILRRHSAGATYPEMVEYIHSIWDETFCYDWTNEVANAQICTIGLLYGEGDFEKAITRTVLVCFDTDCNGATVGSIMGMILGAKALPSKWTAIMHDTIHTSVDGYNLTTISGISEEMFQLYLKYKETLHS